MAKATNTTKVYKPLRIYPLISPEERLAIWEKVRGMWKNRKPEPIKELKKMRKEWDRRLSSLRK